MPVPSNEPRAGLTVAHYKDKKIHYPSHLVMLVPTFATISKLKGEMSAKCNVKLLFTSEIVAVVQGSWYEQSGHYLNLDNAGPASCTKSFGAIHLLIQGCLQHLSLFLARPPPKTTLVFVCSLHIWPQCLHSHTCQPR